VLQSAPPIYRNIFTLPVIVGIPVIKFLPFVLLEKIVIHLKLGMGDFGKKIGFERLSF